MPPMSIVSEGHFVHCFRHEEVAASVPASDTFNVFMAEAERILARRTGDGLLAQLPTH
jgi:oligopeptide transport system ATP-binding protein